MLRVAQIAVYTTHKNSVGRTYNCWMLNSMHRVTRRLNLTTEKDRYFAIS
jgi:hypothetical protein